ncbi:MAG: hypothetical protein VX910_05000 [Candidatus Latescibacterota bacterium]|nr:hypothetical protein [Candidatus Latescibacterota bacterium]
MQVHAASGTHDLKVPRHPRDLEHPPEVRLGTHEGDGLVHDWKQEIHQHRQPGELMKHFSSKDSTISENLMLPGEVVQCNPSAACRINIYNRPSRWPTMMSPLDRYVIL